MKTYEVIKQTPMPDLIIMTDEDGTNWGIPEDPNNSDYQAYLKQLKEPK